MLIEDGFVTLNDNEFLLFDLEASGLREGRYIRVSGVAEDSFGEEASIRLFGRLIENSVQGSIYGFTGSLTHDDIKYKVIYTTSLTGLTNISTTTETETQEEGEIVVHIARGSSNVGFGVSYVEAGELRHEKIIASGSAGLRANYFSPDRVTIEPGTSVTFVNDDDVAHRIVSGTGLGSNSRVTTEMVICETPAEKLPEGFSHGYTSCAFTFDGRIDSETIEPGESWTGLFDEAGFYRIIDPDYPWMNIVVYSFPESDSEVIRRVGANEVGN
jgi:plastocyanin